MAINAVIVSGMLLIVSGLFLGIFISDDVQMAASIAGLVLFMSGSVLDDRYAKAVK